MMARAASSSALGAAHQRPRLERLAGGRDDALCAPWLARARRDTRDALPAGVITAVLLPHVGPPALVEHDAFSAGAAVARGAHLAAAATAGRAGRRWWCSSADGSLDQAGIRRLRANLASLLAVLLALKTLELRGASAFVVFFSGFSCCWRTSSLAVAADGAVDVLLTVWGLGGGGAGADADTGTDEAHLAVAARRAAHTTLLGLPVMVLLFMFFPRIAPLWGACRPSRSAHGPPTSWSSVP